MSWLRRVWPFGWTGPIIALAALSALVAVCYQLERWPFGDHRTLRERFRFTHVSRTNLLPILNAPGRLESSNQTVIRCQLENTSGSRSGAGGSSTVLTLLPEGTAVKQGDVLATLDGSTYDEMYQQQLITVEQAKASHLHAQLTHEVALLAVHEYREGTVEGTLKGMEGSIALARSDVARLTAHLSWTMRMKEKGYASVAQIVSEQHSVAQMSFSLERQLMSLDLFKRFTQPKTLKSLDGQVTTALTSMNNEKLRLQRQLDRLALFKKQLDRCTIRAPHDGVLYYYKDPNPRRRNVARVEEGMSVYQRQPLFYLPDLTQMEVQVAIIESVVDRIRPGLPARVRFEAIPDLVLAGHVVSVGSMPASQGQEGEDIRYFISLIKLDAVAPGLKPGMSTRVDIALTRRTNVLAVPHEALKSDRGKKFCLVAHEEKLERREVRIGEETTDLVEVTAGLEEGEWVALNAPSPPSHAEPLLNFDEIESIPTADTHTVAASRD
jgi:HlyD family secretion protein